MDRINHRQRWETLHENRRLRQSLRPEIRDSWERSYQYGVLSELRDLPVCTNEQLRLARHKSSFLLDTALPIMENLMDCLVPGYVAMLFNNNACVLSVVGDAVTVKQVNEAGFGEGSLWDESIAGTNAAALGFNLARPISVNGYENFALFGIEKSHSFAPIIDQQRVVGGISVIGPIINPEDMGNTGNHTLGMVVAAARHIGSKKVFARYNEILNQSMNEGVLVINSQNRIVYMNKSCYRLLKLREGNICSFTLDELVDKSKSDNYYFWQIISRDCVFADESVTIVKNGEKLRLSVTSTPFDAPDMYFAGRVIVLQEEERINRLIRNYVGGEAKLSFADIIGQDPRFEQVIKYAKSAASSNSNILLLGESGTGKDIIAQAMHNDSPRRNNPFVAINCAAIPRELIASELFGYDDGAFTGARKGGNMGKFELASQGTIFLDEIGDMPLDMQASLLRVIEDKSVRRLGSNKLIPINVRIVAATNKDLETEIRRNRFRRDLYYRLGVIRICIPPLRERREDIPLLTDHSLESLCERLNKPLKKLAPEVEQAFLEYDWPGNVRELQNVLEGAIQMSNDPIITFDLISFYITNQLENIPNVPIVQAVSHSEEDLILSYLQEYQYNKAKTAEALGISRKTLYKRLRKYDLM